MVLYKKKQVPVFKYFFGLIVFMLGLTLAFADVYGLQLPFGQQATNSYNNHVANNLETSDDSARTIEINTDNNDTQNQETDTEPIPTSVPEPSTLILLASGLGLLRMAHRK